MSFPSNIIASIIMLQAKYDRVYETMDVTHKTDLVVFGSIRASVREIVKHTVRHRVLVQVLQDLTL